AIAFCFVLDHHSPTTGPQTARAVWRVGLFNVLTTMGSFLMLAFSGFPGLGEVGVFAALGVGFAFVYVQTVFRAVFVRLARARRRALLRRTAAMRWRDGLPLAVPVAAVVGMAVLGLLARPTFSTDVAGMNGVSAETLAAEKAVKDVWGDFSQKVSL